VSSSNIFLQLITASGPVVGEGLLEGWEGSIELREFSWGMHALKDPAKKGMGAALASVIGVGKPVTIKMEPLQFVKRFDIASAQIHLCLDNHLPVVSASITVLHIKPGGRSVHQPGFVLLATDGHFSDVKIDLSPDGNAAELVETVTLNFRSINIAYMKNVGKDNLPTAPFFYSMPKS
jgi:type VI protein secretion system component Hcp